MKQDISMMKETTLRRDQILDTAKIIINGEREDTERRRTALPLSERCGVRI